LVFTCPQDAHGWDRLHAGVFDGRPVSTRGQQGQLLLIPHLCRLGGALGFALLEVQAIFLGGLG